MKTQGKKQPPLRLQQKIKQLETEIKILKKQLLKSHFVKNAEQDYDIKSHIIDKQNQIIELYINYGLK
jgi:hypothetical protein